jgi:hypothetical protein
VEKETIASRVQVPRLVNPRLKTSGNHILKPGVVRKRIATCSANLCR